MTIDTVAGRRKEVHTLRLYEPDLVRRGLEVAGFSSEALDRYCDFSFWPGYAAFAALKPGAPVPSPDL